MSFIREDSQPLDDSGDLDEFDDPWAEADNIEESEDLERSSFVCEDCDYRWDEAAPEEIDGTMMVCPMCGSTNVTQL